MLSKSYELNTLRFLPFNLDLLLLLKLLLLLTRPEASRKGKSFDD